MGKAANPEVVQLGPTTRDTLLEQVEEAIHRKLAYASRTVTVEIDDQFVVLEGEVPSFYNKQLAQEAVRTISGVRQVVNRIRVVD